MKNRIDNFYNSDEEFDEEFDDEFYESDNEAAKEAAAEFFDIISDMVEGVSENLLFDDNKNEENLEKYREAMEQLAESLPKTVCENCGNVYYAVEGVTKNTVHPSGAACHWCNYGFYLVYYRNIRDKRATARGTYAENNIYN